MSNYITFQIKSYAFTAHSVETATNCVVGDPGDLFSEEASRKMGNCLIQGYIDVQETVNRQMRRDIDHNTEVQKELQAALTFIPKSETELKTLQAKVATTREIAELKSLIALREEVDGLKLQLRDDPSLVSVKIKEELKRLNEQVDIMKNVQNLSNKVAVLPTYASIAADRDFFYGQQLAYHDWQVKRWSEGSFTIKGDAITVLHSGFYQIFLDFDGRAGYCNATKCVLLINNLVVKAVTQTSGGTKMQYMGPLGTGDVITVTIEMQAALSNSKSKWPGVQVDFVKISG